MEIYLRKEIFGYNKWQLEVKIIYFYKFKENSMTPDTSVIGCKKIIYKLIELFI